LLAGPIIDRLHFKTMKYQRKKRWILQAEFAERIREKTPGLKPL
jgi:hypothetical protein